MVSDYAIRTLNLTKKFKDLVAVNNLNLEVKKGEVFGFLGHNGAGKTTAIRMILGLSYPTNGSIQIMGNDILDQGFDIKRDLGFLPERVGFYSNLTAWQTMGFYCELKGKPKDQIEPLLKRVGLHEAAKKKVGTFSRGMVQLLGIAQSMIGRPKLMVLDEPAGGLDPRKIRMVKDSILEAKRAGATIFFSSHILGEVEEICDRVAIINQGDLVAVDTVKNLSEFLEMKPRLWLQLSKVDEKAVGIVRGIDGVSKAEIWEDWIWFESERKVRTIVMSALQDEGYEIVDFRTEEPSLEDVFLRVTSDSVGGRAT